MKNYILTYDADANIVEKIEAKNYIRALEKALEILGYWVTENSE